VIEQNHKIQYSEKKPERDGGDEDNSQPGKGNQLRSSGSQAKFSKAGFGVIA